MRLRGWGTSRICRDYYDLWNIMKSIDKSEYDVPLLINKKFKVRNVVCNSPSDFFTDDLVETARNEWQTQLSPFVKYVPDFNQVVLELRESVYKIWE